MIGLALAAVAAVQMPPPPDATALLALRSFTACVADRAPRATAAVLNMDFRAPGYAERRRRLLTGSPTCVPGGRIGSAGVLAAGGLAERLVLRWERGQDFAARIASAPPTQARSDQEYLGLCLVRKQPADAIGWLRSEPASAAEARAVAAIKPAMAGCMSRDGTLRINKPALRALVALAACRLTAIGSAS